MSFPPALTNNCSNSCSPDLLVLVLHNQVGEHCNVTREIERERIHTFFHNFQSLLKFIKHSHVFNAFINHPTHIFFVLLLTAYSLRDSVPGIQWLFWVVTQRHVSILIIVYHVSECHRDDTLLLNEWQNFFQILSGLINHHFLCVVLLDSVWTQGQNSSKPVQRGFHVRCLVMELLLYIFLTP